MSQEIEYSYGNITLVLDPTENYEGGTPVMVVKKDNHGNWEATASYWCAVDTGVLNDGEPTAYGLQKDELRWLNRQYDNTIRPFFDELEKE